MKIQSDHKFIHRYSETVDLQSDTPVFSQSIQSQGWVWVGREKCDLELPAFL